jgi:hypothetical protein
MLEGIRSNLMRKYQRKRDAIRAMEKLEVEEDEASHCMPIVTGDGLFEVDCKGMKYVVNLY